MKQSGETIPQDLPKIGRSTLTAVGIVLVLALAGFFVLGYLPRHHRIAQREKMAKEARDKPVQVLVVRPTMSAAPIDLSLPADIRGYASTALYARTNGFLGSWKTDINDRVKRGELMAVISAPDTDAEREQAEASLHQQQTNYELAAATEKRYRGLIAIEGVTQEQLDQYHSSTEQAKANVGAAAAAVDRLKALVGFERITAPFDGIVTARNYDVGALVSASNTGPGQELFDVVEDDRLRIFVNVPQAYAPLVRFNQPVDLILDRNFSGHHFAGSVTRSAGAIDPLTRTLRTELDFKNDDPAGHLFPGMYGRAVFHLKRDRPAMTVPTSSLLFESDGKLVAVIGDDNKVHFHKVTLGNDFGIDIEVLSGLKGGEKIVVNPAEHMVEGATVVPMFAQDKGSAAGDGQSSEKKADR